jgi:hypothetical protein
MKMLWAAILFLASNIVAGAHCPLGYWEFQESCYFFSYDKRSWHIAEDFCESMGNGYLTSVETAFENSKILGEYT